MLQSLLIGQKEQRQQKLLSTYLLSRNEEHREKDSGISVNERNAGNMCSNVYIDKW